MTNEEEVFMKEAIRLSITNVTEGKADLLVQ